ncbi:hypothetical protein GCM10022204_32620 [Microlunatus aurantiacus]|uniref:Uncharacterized protein n=1 Tax=Microlunatus aurantiacus TaxID=446786 RepID=A0ABP7DWT4_9ACTN
MIDIRMAQHRCGSDSVETTDRLVFVDDPGVLSTLAAEGRARWVLPVTSPGFVRFGRVRLRSVRAWLEGARVPSGGAVSVRLATRGDYLERLGGSFHRFVSAPLVRDFRYRVVLDTADSPDWLFPDGTSAQIELDGVVDESDGLRHFQPTPMAEWHLTATGDGLDLTDVTRVVMEFTGAVNPRTEPVQRAPAARGSEGLDWSA